MVRKKKTNIGTALHLDPKRQAEAELKRQVIEVADDVFDRYVWGESFQAIADTLPFKVTGWKLRDILMNSPETAETYANVGIHRAHNLVDATIDYGRTAAAIGDAAGLRVAIDTNLKVASKLHAAEYGDSKKVELTGAGGGPVKLLALTDEELLKIAAQGLKDSL
jgi:hypothetical protein